MCQGEVGRNSTLNEILNTGYDEIMVKGITMLLMSNYSFCQDLESRQKRSNGSLNHQLI
jgi:hypothetical protein